MPGPIKEVAAAAATSSPKGKAAAPAKAPAAAAPAAEAPAAAAAAPAAGLAAKAAELMGALGAATPEARVAAATAAAKFIKNEAGIKSLVDLEISKAFVEAAEHKKSAEARMGAMEFLRAMLVEFGQAAEPFILQQLTVVFSTVSDKSKNVGTVAETVISEYRTFIASRPNTAIPLIDVIFEGFKMGKWQSKNAALQLLLSLIGTAPVQIWYRMPEIVPLMTELMWDTRAEVGQSATDCLTACLNIINNKDLTPFIPVLVAALRDPQQVSECIQQLASTTFVQTVSRAALSGVVPLILRGLRESTSVRRQSAKIASNMCKLVEKPSEASPFIGPLTAALTKAVAEIADPEAREVCETAIKQLDRISTAATTERKTADKDAIKERLVALLGENKVAITEGSMLATSVDYVSNLLTLLTASDDFDESRWDRNVVPYLEPLTSGAKAITDSMRTFFQAASVVKEEVDVEDDAEELCNCHFTLAYGDKILLHNADMKLLRGRRYGLLGANDSGKSTLMRAIANGQVDGFPPANEVTTVFVEADIQGEMSHLSCMEYILADERIRKCGAPREKVAEVLSTVGFTPAMQGNGVSTLSGGWRMKLALARAMLQNADILLLDEPTNHLDVVNVAWVQNYLNSLTNVTSIIVSHDSGLLDKCCTHILQISDLKLHTYRGNLSAFVEKFPEAKTYFDFKATKMRFKFPQPGFLQGIKTKGKALLKMSDCSYTYPINQKPTISGITVQVSLSSRVACVGVNGAGKSTMIKLLTGELEPQTGVVWKHSGCRVAYVAQHAFHHIESHLTKTPNEYLRWRYEGGDDKEGLEKVTVVETEEDIAKLRTPFMWDITNEEGVVIRKEKRSIERLTGARRLTNKEHSYEVQWVGMLMADNSYVPRKRLEQLGIEKQLKVIDDVCQSREGLYQRPLTMANVEKHLEDFGLHREYGSHTRMAALSGGHKVKVVLAAAMWNQPHVLILDEPTNYLDRDSLGALASAIREFEGGVVMITHNNEFCSQLCPETWVLENGRLDCRGDAEWMSNLEKEKVEFVALETMTDALGNTSKVKQPKKVLSRKERMQRDKRRAAKLANGEALSSDDEDE